MKLRTWIEQGEGRAVELALKLCVSRRLVDAYAAGQYRSPKTASAISAATGGEVTVQELLYPDGLPEGAAMCPRTDGSDDLPSAA